MALVGTLAFLTSEDGRGTPGDDQQQLLQEKIDSALTRIKMAHGRDL